MVADPDSTEGSPRLADIDGDGTDDEVGLHLDFEAPTGCQAFLAVEAGGRRTVEPIWLVGAAGGLPQPSLYSFSDLDGRQGYEIVVNEASGASTQFAAAYGWQNGDLVPIVLPDTENGLFAFGGSVGHIEAADCSPEADIVVSRAVPAAGRDALRNNRYQVRRTIYSFVEGGLKKETAELTEIPLEELDQFPEFRLGLFGTCGGP